MIAGSLKNETEQPWRAIELGRGGHTVEKMLQNLSAPAEGGFTYGIIPAALSGCEQANASTLEKCQESLRGLQPTYILLNVGVNDVGFSPPWSLPNQTTWRANLTTLIDAFHAQWPDALIGISLPWKRQPGGDETVFDTMAASIQTVIASRAFAFELDDERAWFKGNADGDGSYSDDTPSGTFIHYNPLPGQLAAAAAKLAELPALP